MFLIERSAPAESRAFTARIDPALAAIINAVQPLYLVAPYPHFLKINASKGCLISVNNAKKAVGISSLAKATIPC